MVARGRLIVLGLTLKQTAVAEDTVAMLASQLGLFDRASVSSPNSGADLGYILTDFLNERRRRNIRRGFRGMLAQKISWVCQSFRRDINQFHSPLIKPCKTGGLFHLSISTWYVSLYQKIFITKTLTDFRRTVETTVDPRID